MQEAQSISVEAGTAGLKVKAEETTLVDAFVVLVIAITAGLIASFWFKHKRRALGFLVGALAVLGLGLVPLEGPIPSSALWLRSTWLPDGRLAWSYTLGADTWTIFEGDAQAEHVFSGNNQQDEGELLCIGTGDVLCAISDRDPASNNNVYMGVEGAVRFNGESEFGPTFWLDNGAPPPLTQSNWRPLLSNGPPGRWICMFTTGWAQNVTVVEVFGEGEQSVSAPLVLDEANQRNIAGNACRIGGTKHLGCWSQFILPHSILVRWFDTATGAKGPIHEVTQAGHGEAREPILSRWPGDAFAWISWSESGVGKLAVLKVAPALEAGRVAIGPVSIGTGHWFRVEAKPKNQCIVVWDDSSGSLTSGRAGRFRLDAHQIVPDGPSFQFQAPRTRQFAQQPPSVSGNFGGTQSYVSKDNVGVAVP